MYTIKLFITGKVKKKDLKQMKYSCFTESTNSQRFIGVLGI